MLAGTALILASAIPGVSSAQTPPGAREVEVVVENGYRPARIEVAPGERVRLRFVRRDYGPCTREVVFPTLNLRRELPTGQAVVIDLPVLPLGETTFHCGMNMVRGVLIVSAPQPAPRPPPPTSVPPPRDRPR